MEKYVYGNGLISSEKTEGTVENSNTADAKTDSTKTETAGTLTVYHCDLFCQKTEMKLKLIHLKK